jgi:hypothetical protein
VLIAIVTDSYEVIQNDRAAIVFWSNRLDFVAEMDAITYGLRDKLGCAEGEAKGPAASQTYEQEEPHDQRNAYDEFNKKEKDPFDEGWKAIIQLFDQNLYDDIDLRPSNIEFWCYFFFRGLAVVFVIPVWVCLGLLTAGWLWPPQIRAYLFVQRETAISRSDVEKHKLEQLKAIQNGLKTMRTEMKSEMASDREEMIRMKNEIDLIQSEVTSDLRQLHELMTTLLEMGRERAGRR